MKPREWQITIEDNDKHTIKTENGSFKSSGGRHEIMTRWTDDQGVTVEKTIEYTQQLIKEAKDKDQGENKQWLKGGDK